MSERTDLTRWNRSGSSRIRYVDGNAANFLEELRIGLSKAMPNWTSLPHAPAAEESDIDHRKRLLAQYQGERRDLGWELARSFARACHLVTEHIDTYANEGYLRTATQWDNVRKLVEMLDYHPAPPASAVALLVLLAKEERGEVKAGLQIKHAPPDGGAPIVFETLSDVEVDPVLNAVRMRGWNRSVTSFNDAAAVRPARPAGQRPVIDIQGVGGIYSGLLNAYKQAQPGSQGPFTIADLGALEASGEDVGISDTWLWEFKTKAEIVLGIQWDQMGFAAPGQFTLLELVSMPDAALIGLSRQPAQGVREFKKVLRRLQISLDEPAFASMRLDELVGDAGSAAQSGSLWIAPKDSEVSAGQIALVVREAVPLQGAVVHIDAIDPKTRALQLRDAPFQPNGWGWLLGETSLLMVPDEIRRPRLNGADVVRMDGPHGLVPGDTIAWRTNDWSSDWQFGRVDEADELGFVLEGSALPPPGAPVYKALPIQSGPTGLIFPTGPLAVAHNTAAGFPRLYPNGDWTPEEATDTSGVVHQYLKLTDSTILEIFLVPQNPVPLGHAAASRAGQFDFDGGPGELAGGQWVVGDDGGVLHALRIAQVIEREDSYSVVFESGGGGRMPVGDESPEILEGVGEVYGEALAGDPADVDGPHIDTVAKLADLDLETVDLDISPVWLAEFKAKAQIVLGFAFDPIAFGEVLGDPLLDIVSAPLEALAEATGRGEREIQALLDGLRLVQIALDEPVFARLTLLDFVPAHDDGPSVAPIDRLELLYGPFTETLRPVGYDYNATPLMGNLLLPEPADDLFFLLERRAEVYLERAVKDGFRNGRKVRVTGVYKKSKALEFVPELTEADGFTVGNTVLRGNIVLAGHGETRPEKVLGGGNAAESNQTFVFEVANVSFVPDATQPSGVRAEVKIEVDGRIWQQVPTLKYSRPADPHLTVHMTEDAFPNIRFGNGRNGKRLPNGTNNIRIVHRAGTGLAGNVPAGSLVKTAKPHRLIESVRQPEDATGGNDMEPVESLRDNAPATVLTLERAVSLSDFENLAMGQSSVWQASAVTRQTLQRVRTEVVVTVVPAGGGALGELQDSLHGFLSSHSQPGIALTVQLYESLNFNLEVTAQIDTSQYNPPEVLERMRTALLDAFSLRNRGLGHDLYLSEVYDVVERVQGVANSRCVIEGDAALLRLASAEMFTEAMSGVIYLDPRKSSVILDYREFQL